MARRGDELGLDGVTLPNPSQPHAHSDKREDAQAERIRRVDQLAPCRERGDPRHDEFEIFLGCEARLASVSVERRDGEIVRHALGNARG